MRCDIDNLKDQIAIHFEQDIDGRIKSHRQSYWYGYIECLGDNGVITDEEEEGLKQYVNEKGE